MSVESVVPPPARVQLVISLLTAEIVVILELLLVLGSEGLAASVANLVVLLKSNSYYTGQELDPLDAVSKEVNSSEFHE